MRSPFAEHERDRLLAVMLPDVAFDGWHTAAVRAAARRVGIPAGEAEALFPRGAPDLIAAFSDWADRQMLERLSAAAAVEDSLSRRVAQALRLRFAVLTPWREAMRRGLAVLALPQHVPLGLRLLANTADAIWRGIGDHPSDFSFYTKRATLGAIIAATTLYWLDDRSPGFIETEAFIDRRLADLHRLSSLRARLTVTAETLPNPLRLLHPMR